MKLSRRKMIAGLGLGFLAVGGVTTPALIAHLPKSSLVNHEDHIVMRGYDVVSYFQNGPLQGTAEFSATYQGHQYLFANAQNRDAFQENPQAFVPQYGAWCATAMAAGMRVIPNPQNFEIRDGKLYVFFNYLGVDAKKSWQENTEEKKPAADREWQKLLSQKAQA